MKPLDQIMTGLAGSPATGAGLVETVQTTRSPATAARRSLPPFGSGNLIPGSEEARNALHLKK